MKLAELTSFVTAASQYDLTAQALRQEFNTEMELGDGLVFDAFGFDLGKILQADKKAGARVVNGTANFEEISRSGHLFRMEGADLSQFKKNPVVLAMHEMATPELMPGVIGNVRSVSIEGKSLNFQGMTFDDDPLSEAWFQKVSKGLVRMVSIGSRPLEWEVAEKEITDSKKQKRVMRFIDVLAWELVEISVVPIGANRKAMIRRGEQANASTHSDVQRIESLRREVEELRSVIAENAKHADAVEDDSGDACEAFGDASFPDAAFLVEKGADKKAGKSVQKFRHLPHHRKSATDPADNKSVDIPHLRNALARVAQVKPALEDKEAFIRRARAHLMKHARALLKSHKEALGELLNIEGIDDATIDEEPAGMVERALGLAKEISQKG